MTCVEIVFFLVTCVIKLSWLLEFYYPHKGKKLFVRGDGNCFYRSIARVVEGLKPIIENTGKSGEISPGQSNENANTEELPNHSMA